MDVVAVIFLSVFVVSQALGLSQPSTLIFRHQGFDSYQGSFKPDLFHHLSTTTIARSYVMDTFDCVFKCMTETTCYSFNFAAYRDSSGLYLCELLANDKYRASEGDLQENGTFHHFSPLVSEIPVSVNSIMLQPLCNIKKQLKRKLNFQRFKMGKVLYKISSDYDVSDSSFFKLDAARIIY